MLGSWDDPIILDGASGSYTFDFTSDMYNGITPNGYMYFKVSLADTRTAYTFTIPSDGTQLTGVYPGPIQDDGFRFVTSSNVVRNYPNYADTAWWIKLRPWNFATYTVSWTTSTTPDRPYTFDLAQTVALAAGSVTYDNEAPDLRYRWYRIPIPDGATYTFTSTEADWFIEAYDKDQNYIDYGDKSEGRPLTVTGQAGSDIWVKVYPFIQPPETAVLNWEAQAPPPYVVPNNDFATPTVINARVAGNVSYDNTGATQGAASSQHTDGARSIWFEPTPPAATSYVRFEATPGITDPSGAPRADLYEWDPTSSYWNSVKMSGTANAVAVGRMSPDKQYRLALYFPDGAQNVWDSTGQLGWTLSPVPTNSSQDGATVATQSTTITPAAGGAQETQWFTVTAPIDGGLFIVLGSESGPPTGATGAAWLLPETVPTFIPWRSASNPTAAYVREVHAGDTVRVRVDLSGGATVNLRWGVSGQVVWGEWQDASFLRAGTDTGSPLGQRAWFEQFYPYAITTELNALGDQGSARWTASCETAEMEYTDPSDHDFAGARALVDSGQGQRADLPRPPGNVNMLGGGTPTTYSLNVDDLSWSAVTGIGYGGRMQQGPIYWTEGAGIAGGSFSQNEVHVANAAYEVSFSTREYADDWGQWDADRLPVIKQGTLNGLVTPEELASGGETLIKSRLRQRAVEWRDGVGTKQVNLYHQYGVSWTRSSGSSWVGTVSHAPVDPFSLQVRRSSATLAELETGWLSRGEVAAMPIEYEYQVPADGVTQKGSEPFTAQWQEWALDTANIESLLPALGGGPWQMTFLVTTSLFANNDPIDTSRILQRSYELNGGGIGSQPFWDLSGAALIYFSPAAVYPDYRIGTYVENLDPIDPGADLYPGKFLNPTSRLDGAPNGLDVNFSG